jgi:DNA-directed RNA polymerase specialized sigma24 family protein
MTNRNLSRTPIVRAQQLYHDKIPAAEQALAALRDKLNQAAREANDAGMTYEAIGKALGTSTPNVQYMVQKAKGTPSPSRRKETRGVAGA